MNKIITIILTFIVSQTAVGQYAYFAERGKIAFDKTTYTKARMRSTQQQMSQNFPNQFGGGGRMFDIENFPESTTEKFILEFDENSTLMYLDPEFKSEGSSTARGGNGGQARGAAGGGGARGATRGQIGVNIGGGRGGDFQVNVTPRIRPNNSQKILAQNIKKSTSEVQINLDDIYIITDSLLQITWRFTDEYRNIAGYECRRVNGATKDSLYVVAFYTDEIPLSAGPALINGLPGMILGLVIPEMHVQYWATKVDYTNDLVQNNWKDKKAKTIQLDDFVSSFGRFFQRGRDNNTSKRQVQEQLIY